MFGGSVFCVITLARWSLRMRLSACKRHIHGQAIDHGAPQKHARVSATPFATFNIYKHIQNTHMGMIIGIIIMSIIIFGGRSSSRFIIGTRSQTHNAFCVVRTSSKRTRRHTPSRSVPPQLLSIKCVRISTKTHTKTQFDKNPKNLLGQYGCDLFFCSSLNIFHAGTARFLRVFLLLLFNKYKICSQ